MDNNNAVWVVVAVVVALVAVGLLLWTLGRRRDAKRRAEAEELREQLRREDAAVRQREAMAAETAARARAAQAEAEAKAAEANRLQHAAEGHHAEVSSSREELEKRRATVAALDPRGDNGEAERSADHFGGAAEVDRQVRPAP